MEMNQMGKFKSYRNCKSRKLQAILGLGPRAAALKLKLNCNPLEGLLGPTPEFLIH